VLSVLKGFNVPPEMLPEEKKLKKSRKTTLKKKKN
jgi:hypothetical protein